MEGAAKVIRDEADAQHNEMEMITLLGIDRIGIGRAELESRRILAESAANVAKSAELFNHRIGITYTAPDCTKDGLSFKISSGA